MDVVLDTNALSALADGDVGLENALSGFQTICLPVIVLGEYRYGISLSKYRKAYEDWLRELLKDATVLPVLNSTTEQYSAIVRRLKEAGTPIPTNDIWISALALEHRLTLITRDHHFTKVAGLSVLPY